MSQQFTFGYQFNETTTLDVQHFLCDVEPGINYRFNLNGAALTSFGGSSTGGSGNFQLSLECDADTSGSDVNDGGVTGSHQVAAPLQFAIPAEEWPRPAAGLGGMGPFELEMDGYSDGSSVMVPARRSKLYLRIIPADPAPDPLAEFEISVSFSLTKE